MSDPRYHPCRQSLLQSVPVRHLEQNLGVMNSVIYTLARFLEPISSSNFTV